MTSSRAAAVIAISLAATACNGQASPTMPSPTAAIAMAPSVNLSGTWAINGDAFMTITQDGAGVTGIQLPATMDLNGRSAVITGTVTGSVSGDRVTLSLQDIVTVRGAGDTMTCMGGDSFDGRVEGDTLTGVLISGTTRYVCDRGMPLPTPQISGPMTFTRK